MAVAAEPAVIGGHPTVNADRDHAGLPPIQLQICANCGDFLGKVLWLAEDRWLCTSCKSTTKPRRLALGFTPERT